MGIISTACRLLLLFTLLTGFLYPFAILGLAQFLFPWQANGSLIKQENKIMGSTWIGQSFTSPEFFYGRPSATLPFPCNARNSSGSNLALSNPMLKNIVQLNINHLQQLDPSNHQKIPMDLVTQSASGLDPDISPESAYYQAARIAATRNVATDVINQIIKQHIIPPYAGFIGEPRVNVLALNIALLSLTNITHPSITS